MSLHYRSLFPEIKQRIKSECVRETPSDTEQLLSLPYPYIVPAARERDALFYWDTYFINMGILRMGMIEHARHNVENLVYLQRRFGHVPASNRKDAAGHSHPPMLPWMVRDIYRATGDKEWLRRVVPDLLAEFKFWTKDPHTSVTGLYRYTRVEGDGAECESGWAGSPRFSNITAINPVDLNALLYRNAQIIHDLQIEVDGQGDESLIKRSKKIADLMDLCWDSDQSFYFDNDFEEKSLTPVRSLAGYLPLFVELVDQERAESMQKQLKNFVASGGVVCMSPMDQKSALPWSYPLSYAPYVYYLVKGLIDYEMVEDAADIGTNWLNMVREIHKTSGEFWEWYNAVDPSNKAADGTPNRPLLGWTAGVFIALTDALGLD